MKKITMIAVIVSLAFTAAAQKLKQNDVPAAVKQSFAKLFPGAAAKWEKEDGKYEAEFKQGGNEMSAVFESAGTFVESETEIKVSELPSAVAAYVKEHYKNKSIKEGAKITKADGTVNYEAEVGGKDIIFDANGKFIKEVKA